MNKVQIVQVLDQAVQEANNTKQKVDSSFTFIEMTARVNTLQEVRDFIINNLDEPAPEENTEEPKAEKKSKESK